MVFKYLLNKIRRQSSKKGNTTTAEGSTGASGVESVGEATPATAVLPPVAETKAAAAARGFFENYNSHDADKVAKTMSPKCIIEFLDAEMLCAAFMEENRTILKCFPDIHFAYDTITDNGPGVATVEKIRVTATHTGAPYGFGPYPAIEPNGCKIKNDPEDATCTIDEETGLITRMKITPHGRLSGPPGFYLQIGGILF